MFEKVSRAAETLATSVSTSRRDFLGRVGQAALAAVSVLGGFLLSAKEASAGSGVACCLYSCENSLSHLYDKVLSPCWVHHQSFL
jgi:hypothetical protein